ncbi:hypothetical protein AB3S75_016077 [Citrus x aurantiifolia]
MVIPSIFIPGDWSFTFYEGLYRHPDSILKVKAVAELGCGNGWITIAIAEKWLPMKFCWSVVLMPCASFCFLPYQCLQGLHHDFSHHFLSLCFARPFDIYNSVGTRSMALILIPEQ